LRIGDVDMTSRLRRDHSGASVSTPAPGWPPRMRVELPPVFIPAQAGNLKVWYTAPDGREQGVAEVRVKLTTAD
jgi:hypothetical protein